MAPASSTAPPGRCARPARRSSPMSTPRPWSTASRRTRSSPTGRSPGAAGRRRTTARGYSGRMTLATALIKSINTVPVRLAKDHLTIAPIKAMAEAMGVESPLNSHKTMVLGTSGMTVMDQATGYSVFADDGFAGTASRHHPAHHAFRRSHLRLRPGTRRRRSACCPSRRCRR